MRRGAARVVIYSHIGRHASSWRPGFLTSSSPCDRGLLSAHNLKSLSSPFPGDLHAPLSLSAYTRSLSYPFSPT